MTRAGRARLCALVTRVRFFFTTFASIGANLRVDFSFYFGSLIPWVLTEVFLSFSRFRDFYKPLSHRFARDHNGNTRSSRHISFRFRGAYACQLNVIFSYPAQATA